MRLLPCGKLPSQRRPSCTIYLWECPALRQGHAAEKSLDIVVTVYGLHFSHGHSGIT